MIYIGNGIYSEATPNEYLQHYGVIGMKWGVRKARQHERNLYRYNRGQGMSRADAKAQYRANMQGVKQYAKANKRTGATTADISKASYNRANSKIKDYDKMLKSQKRRRIAAGVAGAAALTAAGVIGYKYGKKKYDDRKKERAFKSQRDAMLQGIKFAKINKISPDFYDKESRRPNRETRNKFYYMSGNTSLNDSAKKLSRSANAAKKAGVPEDRIMRNRSDINKYFNKRKR